MNELIQALADEAEDYADGIVDAGGEFHPAYTRKLVELIVRECADIAKHHVMNISTYADADFVEKQIQEHFGVE